MKAEEHEQEASDGQIRRNKNRLRHSNTEQVSTLFGWVDVSPGTCSDTRMGEFFAQPAVTTTTNTTSHFIPPKWDRECQQKPPTQDQSSWSLCRWIPTNPPQSLSVVCCTSWRCERSEMCFRDASLCSVKISHIRSLWSTMCLKVEDKTGTCPSTIALFSP